MEKLSRGAQTALSRIRAILIKHNISQEETVHLYNQILGDLFPKYYMITFGCNDKMQHTFRFNGGFNYHELLGILVEQQESLISTKRDNDPAKVIKRYTNEKNL